MSDHRPHVLRVYSRLETGGIEHQMLRLLPRLNAGRFRVSLCLLRRAGALAGPLRERGIEVHVIPFAGRLHPPSLFALARLMRSARVDLVHAHVRESNTSAAVAARLARVPVMIGSIHNMDTIRGIRRIWQDRLVGFLRDGMVAVSQSVKENYCRTVGVDPQRVTVIYNGVDLAEFDAIPRDPARTLAPLGVPNGERVIICVARLVPQKAHEILLAALARCLPRDPGVRLLLVGEGPRSGALREEAARLGVAERVIFAGERSDVPSLLRSSDISALVSTREGFSNVVVESLAAGLPVVATDVGGNAEAIEQGVSGYLTPSGDVETITARLQALLDDEGHRSRMGRAARLRAERFSLDRTLADTEALYDRLLISKGARRAGKGARRAGQREHGA